MKNLFDATTRTMDMALSPRVDSASYCSHYADKTILVTGGAGAIGSALVRKLVSIDAKHILVLDDLSSGFHWLLPTCSRISFVRGSLLDDAAFHRVFSARPFLVFHLAALFANQNSIDHPRQDLLVNRLGTLRVLQASLSQGVNRVILASTSCLSTRFQTVTRAEQGLPKLTTPYQATKLLAELYNGLFRRLYGLSTVTLRLFNSYGPGEVPGLYRNVIPNFFSLALQGQPLPIRGSGTHTRDFTYVGDIVEGFIRAGYMAEADGQTIDIGTGTETQIIQLANMINEISGNLAGVTMTEGRAWDNEIRRCASTREAQSLLGYRAEVALKTGLEHTLAWFQNHESLIRKCAVSRQAAPNEFINSLT